MARRFVEGLGLPWARRHQVWMGAWLPDELAWQPGERDEVSWYDGGSWHQNLRDSTGLTAQPRQYIDISDAPDRVKEIHELVLPHYQALHRHRLKSAPCG